MRAHSAVGGWLTTLRGNCVCAGEPSLGCGPFKNQVRMVPLPLTVISPREWPAQQWATSLQASGVSEILPARRIAFSQSLAQWRAWALRSNNSTR